MALPQSENTTIRLSSELLAILATRGNPREFKRNESLIVEGEYSDTLYILVTGQLKVFTQDKKGRELVYNVLEPGEFFGELTLDGGTRTASVKAIVMSSCVVVERGKLQAFMQEYPEFSECLVMKLISRVRHATRQIKSLGLDGVYERIVTLLNELSVPGEKGRLLPADLTQIEIAGRIAATREMVNIVLRDLVRGGYLAKSSGRRLVITKDLPKHR